MKKIIVISTSKAIHPANIGGTESIIRRIKYSFKQDVNIIFYLIGYGESNENVKYFPNIKALTNSLRSKQNKLNVIKMYLTFSQRLYLCLFRLSNRKINWFLLLTSWSNSFYSKLKLIFDYVLFPYNNGLIVISKRQSQFFNKIGFKNLLINPNIPENYNYNEDKLKDIDFLFLGRIDYTKGIDLTIDFFNYLKINHGINTYIVGIRFPDDLRAEKIHYELLNQNLINYIPVERSNYPKSVENKTIDYLQRAKYFVQPYKNIYGTVDTPILILEAMAANCVVISSNDSNVVDIYGESQSLIQNIPGSLEQLKSLTKLFLDQSWYENELNRVKKSYAKYLNQSNLSLNNLKDKLS